VVFSAVQAVRLVDCLALALLLRLAQSARQVQHPSALLVVWGPLRFVRLEQPLLLQVLLLAA
jgi:hypothetical protein